ncbi:TIGR04063 family PEP-CTERM/XrtA system glycosyltransferase [Aurantiacibacter hainanensis]|uniref:TIGR04063 family PEP-CTERM/XrtA system glycosyltransferase n=1 Tax=Aurantiacibacter hainanensis TaxID=3076114 RepID=UPI0030C74A6E
MTRILHILDHSLPMHSGYTFRTRAIMRAQQGMGLEVRGLTGQRHVEPGPATEQVDGLAFHRTQGKSGGPAGLREWREIDALTQAIIALAQVWRPDVLHAHSPALNCLAAVRAGRRLGIPVVYEIRAFWEDAAVGNLTGREGSLKYRLTRHLENMAVRGSDAVMTICQGLKDDLVARGFSAAKIDIMPNGVDLTTFGNPAERDEALAEELGIGEGPVIGFIGSFYDYEGLDDLIAAMPMLADRHAGAHLLLVGGGPMDEALRAKAAASPVADSIHFTGRVPHAEVERYYALTDIMAYPRKKSRLTDLVTPLKPLEANAQMQLVAASDVGGHRELIRDGETGVLFAPDDPAACAAALADLVDRRAEWDAIRRAAHAHVRENHDWSTNAQRYRTVYLALLGKRDDGRVPAAA